MKYCSFFSGAPSSTIDLLPKGKDWTDSLTEVEGHEAAYRFDGKTAVNVSCCVIKKLFVQYFAFEFIYISPECYYMYCRRLTWILRGYDRLVSGFKFNRGVCLG